MLSFTEFKLAPPFEELLRAAGLDSFDTLMRGEVGTRVSTVSHTEVRVIQLPPGVGGSARKAYLKRSFAERPRKVLASLARVCRPHVDSYRELQHLRVLAARGFACMTPMAWGERRVCGIPREGFLLVDEVLGIAADDYFERADEEGRRRVFHAIGDLLGRLHGEGLFQGVRLKDVMVTRQPETPDEPLSLCLIDRAAAWPFARRVSRRMCLGRLERLRLRIHRRDQPLDADQAAIFAAAYAKAVVAHGVAITADDVAALMTRPGDY